MEETLDGGDAATKTRAVPVWLFVAVAALAVAAAGIAIYFAAQNAAARADLELLSDGIERTRLPTEQAVALAKLAGSRSDPLPEHMGHHGDHHGDHEMHDVHEMTPDEMMALEAQLEAARAAVPALDTLEEAEAAGYVQASGEADGAGAHWVKWSIVDQPFDPATPSMLLFDELRWGEGLELIAFSYWVPSEEEAPEGFVGNHDSWHRHFGLCLENAWVRDERIPRETCDGDWINGNDLWMLHAWVVPGVENALGTFAVVNPKLCERICGAEN